MSILVWFRDKLFGKKDGVDRFTTANPHAQKSVNSQITDAVTTKVTESKSKRTTKKTAKKAPARKKS